MDDRSMNPRKEVQCKILDHSDDNDISLIVLQLLILNSGF
jgi:hypothetical protein